MLTKNKKNIEPPKVSFKILNSLKLPTFDKITSVAVVIFNKNNELFLANHVDRGADLPGGHVEIYEENVYETARREVYEETGSLIENIKLGSIISSDFYGKENLTYMVILHADLKKEEKFQPSEKEKSQGSICLSVENFLKTKSGNKDLMKQIIKRILKFRKLTS